METGVAISPKVDPPAREKFYHLVGQVPESEAAWTERLAALRNWRADPCFQPYWPTIDQMLMLDFTSFKRRAALAKIACALEGYDFNAWREQRDHDLQHAGDHLP